MGRPAGDDRSIKACEGLSVCARDRGNSRKACAAFMGAATGRECGDW
jgi:hypothetical protein